jgi:hypothetical protein
MYNLFKKVSFNLQNFTKTQFFFITELPVLKCLISKRIVILCIFRFCRHAFV